ncbi:SDR family NAD(P)-dependent oxidoreductase [Nocardia aobensis]|uniref:SDR family NAD(P)-dependent oxidoreductase n=1 Tax=Nocardia aobensis TaxID=257277 RepID=A0ABW6PFJ3_9NOCA
MLLKDKVALVTGGGQGIGAGIARCLVREGAKVAVLDRATGPAKELVAEINSSGGSAESWEVDVTDYAAFDAVVDEIDKTWGSIDVLVNNAGVVVPPGPFMDSDPADWDHTLGVDFKGVLHGVKACVPRMQRAGGGAIVNIGSDSARFGEPGIAVYAGAKGAVNSVSKSLAKELASSGIRVNVITPGIIETPMIDLARSTPDGRAMIDATVATIPLSRMGTPREVGDVVVFLASELSSYLTGQSISVNGGMLMFG